MKVVAWVALAVLSGLLGAETIAWCRPVHRWMLRRAAAALPVDHRDRYLEEWLAELLQLPDGPVTRALWALRILLRRRSLAVALGAPSRATSATLKVKRGTDLIVAGGALVVCGPLLIVAAISIRLSSRGPVLFRQNLLDRDGEPFVLLKFRTMSDGEVTPVGRVLRSTALDELPQLINLLRGEMSLVGPRP